MDVALNTLNDGKAADTRLEISIVPDGGGPAVAYLRRDGLRLDPNKTVPEAVPPAGRGFTLDELKHMHIEVAVTQERFSPWRFEMDVVLHFDDGSEALLGTDNQTVSSARPVVYIPLSLASVAGSGLMGKVERLGFGLISKSVESPVYSASGVPHKSTKEFTHMDINFLTGAQGIGTDAKVEISIVSRDGGDPVGYLVVEGQEFPAYQKVSEVVPSVGKGFKIDELKKQQVLVSVTSPRYGTWRCKFDAILHFADGTQALIGSNDLAVSSAGSASSVPLSDATVARPSILGSITKMSFKFLSNGVKQTPEPKPAPGSQAAIDAAAAAAAPANAPVAAAETVQAAPDQFTEMSVKLRSGNRGKDAATRVEISIVPIAGGAPVAYLDLPDQAIDAGRSVKLTVPPAAAGFTASDLKREQIVVKITAAGHVVWPHDMDLVLRFADGSTALWSTGDLTLSDYRNEETIPLSDLSVSRGLLGGAKRLGFGILNTIGGK